MAEMMTNGFKIARVLIKLHGKIARVVADNLANKFSRFEKVLIMPIKVIHCKIQNRSLSG